MKAFIVRRYQEETKVKNVVGTLEGIARAENLAVVLAKDIEDGLRKIFDDFHCQSESSVPTEETTHGTKMYQRILINPPLLPMFLEGPVDIIV